MKIIGETTDSTEREAEGRGAQIAGDHVVGIRRDEEGVEYVAVYMKKQP